MLQRLWRVPRRSSAVERCLAKKKYHRPGPVRVTAMAGEINDKKVGITLG